MAEFWFTQILVWWNKPESNAGVKWNSILLQILAMLSVEVNPHNELQFKKILLYDTHHSAIKAITLYLHRTC